MKKTILLGVALAGVLALTACGDPVTTGTDSAAATEATQHSHAFGQWSEEKAAACTQDGQKKRTCACGEEETEVIAALGHQYGENDRCSRCGAWNETAWKAAMSGDILNNYTNSMTVQVKQTDSDGTVTNSSQTAVYKITADKIHLDISIVPTNGNPFGVEQTIEGERLAQQKTMYSEQFFGFADHYGKFEYDQTKNIYELKEELDITVHSGSTPTILHYTACQLTFSEDGKLVKMTCCYTMNQQVSDTQSTTVETDGECIFSDYGTTVVEDPTPAMDEDVWRAAFEASAFENVTLRAEAEVQQTTASGLWHTLQENTIKLAGNKAHMHLVMEYLSDEPDTPLVDDELYTGDQAADLKNEIVAPLAMFKENFAKFRYNSEKQVYELQQDIEYSDEVEEGTVTACTIGFDANGKLSKITYTITSTITMNNNENSTVQSEGEYNFYDYGTTVVTVK